MDDDYRKPIAMNIDTNIDEEPSSARSSARAGATSKKSNDPKTFRHNVHSKYFSKYEKKSKATPVAKVDDTPNRRITYQHLHSNYTKRRYGHVKSKIGPLIAETEAIEATRAAERKAQRERDSQPEPPKPVVDLTAPMSTDDYLALILAMEVHLHEVDVDNDRLEAVIALNIKRRTSCEELIDKLHEDIRECKERLTNRYAKRTPTHETNDCISALLAYIQVDTPAEPPTPLAEPEVVQLEDVDNDEMWDKLKCGSSESDDTMESWYNITSVDQDNDEQTNSQSDNSANATAEP